MKGAAPGAYLAFVRAAFLKTLAYRLRYFTGIATYLVYVTTYYFLWKALYSGKAPGAEMAGFDLSAMVSYVAIGWIARSFYFNNVDRDIADLVRGGELALALARPLSFQGMMLAEAAGASLFRVLFFTPPVALVLFLLYPLQGPASWSCGAAFVVSAALSFLILAQFNFLVGLISLQVQSIDGIMRAKHYLLELLSGLLMPVPLFPAWLQTLSRCLPFQSIAYLPGSIYLGKQEGRALLGALGVQAAWALGLTAAGAVLWRGAARRLTIQGG